MELNELLESDISFNSKILVSEILKNNSLDVNWLQLNEMVEAISFLLENNYEVVILDSFILVEKSRAERPFNYLNHLKDKILYLMMKLQLNDGLASIFLHDINILKYNILYHNQLNIIKIIIILYINLLKVSKPAKLLFLLNLQSKLHRQSSKLHHQLSTFEIPKLLKNNSLAGYYSLKIVADSSILNKIKYLEFFLRLSLLGSHQIKLSSLNDKANKNMTKLSSFNLGTDNKLLKEKKQELKNKKTLANDLVELLRQKIVDYNQSIGGKSFFPNDWNRSSSKEFYSMLNTLEFEDIKRSIDWFFENDYWKGKIDHGKMISRHYQKYLSGQNFRKSGNLLSKAITNRRGLNG